MTKVSENNQQPCTISDVSDSFIDWFKDRNGYLNQYNKIRVELGKMCILTEKELKKYCKGRDMIYDEHSIDEIQNKIIDDILENMEGIEGFC
jgi:hypothetical protein